MSLVQGVNGVPVKSWTHVNWRAVGHSARTAVAAVVSLIVARLFHLPEDYWAAITTLIILQSTLGVALTVSEHRLAGTALGAAVGAVLANHSQANLIVFGAGIFLLGLICAALRLDRAAYRFASITFAIVALVAHSQPTWIIAAHRFFEVSIGIAVGLLITAAWPERQSVT
jgi:uncharacterized membrane protein YgaE (UPF0421/DUF939 family)